MLANNRVIWSDNGTLKDLSQVLNNYFSGTQVIDFNPAQDKLYIGSDVPFNHRFFSVSVANDVASVATVKHWNGNSWKSAVDVIDFTRDAASATKTLARSGILKWVTDRNETWSPEATTENISELSTLKIYDLYWAQLNFSVSLTGTCALKYVGHKFSTDDDLGGEYPDLKAQAVKTAFNNGDSSKTTWDDQAILAGEYVATRLRRELKAWTKNQIFDWEPFTAASVHKTAEIIYGAFGPDFESKANRASRAFDAAMSDAMTQGIDSNEDGHVETYERVGLESARITR